MAAEETAIIDSKENVSAAGGAMGVRGQRIGDMECRLFSEKTQKSVFLGKNGLW